MNTNTYCTLLVVYMALCPIEPINAMMMPSTQIPGNTFTVKVVQSSIQTKRHQYGIGAENNIKVAVQSDISGVVLRISNPKCN